MTQTMLRIIVEMELIDDGSAILLLSLWFSALDLISGCLGLAPQGVGGGGVRLPPPPMR